MLLLVMVFGDQHIVQIALPRQTADMSGENPVRVDLRRRLFGRYKGRIDGPIVELCRFLRPADSGFRSVRSSNRNSNLLNMKIWKRIIRSKAFIGILGALALVTMLPSVSLADEITWTTRNWSNYQYEENGELKGWGMDIQRMIQRELPQYQHRNLIMNPARRTAEFKTKKNVCSIGLFKNPERKEYMQFGLPDMMTFHLQLYMRREIFEKLGRPKLVSLQRLLENDYGVLAIVRERSYGRILDNILKGFEGADKFVLLRTIAHTSSGFAMLSAERFDFLIEYPENENTTHNMQNIVPVPLEEIPAMVFGHVACAKTEWGANAIKAINKALVKLRPTEEYRRAYGKTLSADQSRVYRKFYNEKFLKPSE
jgi:uncharacterized protein (TIGR02285 family)